MARPIWKGQISFGLVTIPVHLHSAEARSNEIRFNLLDKRNLARIRNQRINETTGKPVEWEDIVKGYELDDGSYVTFTEEELDEVEAQSNQEIEIRDFVPGAAIPFEYFVKPYYLVPEKKGRKGYVILREALKKAKKVGIAKVVIRAKEYLSAVVAQDDTLMLFLLRYAYEIQAPAADAIPDGTLKDYGVTTKEVEIAQQLIQAMSDDWAPEQYKDEYHAALTKFIEQRSKKGGKKSSAPKKTEKTGAEVIDIMGLLKASMEREKSAEKPKKSA